MSRPPHAVLTASLASAAFLLLAQHSAQAGSSTPLPRLNIPVGHSAQEFTSHQHGRGGTPPALQPAPVDAAPQAGGLLLRMPARIAARVIQQGEYCGWGGRSCGWRHGHHHGAYADRNDYYRPAAVPAIAAAPQIIDVQPSTQVFVINPAAYARLPEPQVIAAPAQASMQNGVRVIYLADAPAEVWQRADAPVRSRHSRGAHVLSVQRPLTTKD